jgi:hypothetical protein
MYFSTLFEPQLKQTWGGGGVARVSANIAYPETLQSNSDATQTSHPLKFSTKTTYPVLHFESLK